MIVENYFSWKGQIAIVLVLAGRTAAVTTTQCCHCSAKAAMDSMSTNEHIGVSQPSFMERQRGAGFAQRVIGSRLLL